MATGTRQIERFGGLLRRMPWTGLFFLVGAMAISGLPLLNGFPSEWLTFQALLLGFTSTPGMVRLNFPLAGAMLALTTALAAACFVRAFGISFRRPAAEPSRRRGARVSIRDARSAGVSRGALRRPRSLPGIGARSAWKCFGVAPRTRAARGHGASSVGHGVGPRSVRPRGSRDARRGPPGRPRGGAVSARNAAGRVHGACRRGDAAAS